MNLSQRSFVAVTDFFHAQSGIRLGPDKLALVQGRLQRLANEAGHTDLDAYVGWALSSAAADEQVRLVDRLTTNETYFFREPEHFQYLGAHLESWKGPGTFRVWSGASSSGEEAYRIAMVLRDRLQQRAWQVVGTDLSTSVVDTANKGLYPLSRAEGIPDYYRKRYCLRGHGDYAQHMLMSRELRDHVHFQTANLLEPLPDIGEFQVIFLRNVLIYFDVPSKREIVSRVMTKLAPGGLLFSGHSESLVNLSLPLKTLQPAVYTHA